MLSQNTPYRNPIEPLREPSWGDLGVLDLGVWGLAFGCLVFVGSAVEF